MENITKKSWMKFGLDAEASNLVLSSHVLTRMAICGRKNSPANAFVGEKMHEQTPSNAHAAIEKENREEEGRPTGACTREWPSMPQEAQRWREAVTLWGKGAMLRAEC